MQPDPRSGAIVLAGGLSRRMGTDKARLLWDGETLLERVVNTVGRCVSEVLVVGGHDPELQAARWVDDWVPASGPVGGIYTGLSQLHARKAIVAACDLPFVNPALVRLLIESLRGYDAAVPLVDGRAHGTLAAYDRKCLSALHAVLETDTRKLASVFQKVRTRWVDEREIAAVDPGCRSLVNVNTAEDWARAREAWGLEPTPDV